MRDPRTLGPYTPPRPPSLIDLIQGAGDTYDPAPAPAMAAAATPEPSLGQRIAGMVGGGVGSLASLPFLLPQALAGRLQSEIARGRSAMEMGPLEVAKQKLENEAAQRRAQLETLQLPVQQQLEQAKARALGTIETKIGQATDPRERESLIRGAATGEFRPYAVEPGPAEIAAYQNVLGMQADEARSALTAKRESEQARLQAGLSAEQARLQAGLQRETNRLDNEGRRSIALAGKLPGIEDEKAMRSEFETLPVVKNFSEVRQAYKTIQALPATKAGDLTLLVKYMKLIDPSSSVREGELATADQAGGVPSWIVAQYNRLNSGAGRLDPELRKDFLSRSGDLYQSYLGSHRNLEGQYRDIATRRGLDPRNVVTDFVGQDDAPAAPTPTPDEIRAELARRANAGR
jgi:hypothetical protein